MAYFSLSFFCLLFLFPTIGKSHGDLHQRIDKLSVQILQTRRVDLLLERAQLYRDDGNLTAALQDINAAKTLEPLNSDVLYLNATLALTSAKLDDALKLAQQLLSHLNKRKSQQNQAKYQPVYLLLSNIYLAKKQKGKALFYLKKSISLHSKPTPTHWLQLANLQLQYEGYKQALATLQQALLQSGTSLSIQQRIVTIAIAQTDYKTALYYLDQQLENAASLRELILLVKKSKLLLLKGDNTQAILIKQQAKLALQQLSNNKKNSPIVQSIQQYLM